MKVVLVEPKKCARIVEIEDTLEAMQNAVGGLIEMVYPFFDFVALVCNGEGKILGLPPNRALFTSGGELIDIIYGSFFIVGCTEDGHTSLSDEQAVKYSQMFFAPEEFIIHDI